jgi:hypothetical protein
VPFDGPARAIRRALAIRDRLAEWCTWVHGLGGRIRRRRSGVGHDSRPRRRVRARVCGPRRSRAQGHRLRPALSCDGLTQRRTRPRSALGARRRSGSLRSVWVEFLGENTLADFKISFARRSPKFSCRKRLISSSSSLGARSGLKPWSASAWRTCLRSTSLLIPRSRATCARLPVLLTPASPHLNSHSSRQPSRISLPHGYHEQRRSKQTRRGVITSHSCCGRGLRTRGLPTRSSSARRRRAGRHSRGAHVDCARGCRARGGQCRLGSPMRLYDRRG